MDLLTLVLFVLGLAALVVGAEILVRGAAQLAAAAGVSALVVGLTVVAFGTSAPEMAVSVSSALRGEASLAMGNVVGSNIFNVLFILGVSALLTPLVVSTQLVRFDVPLVVGASLLVWAMARDGAVGRIEGLLLFAGIVVYTVYLVRKSRAEERDARVATEVEPPRLGAMGILRNVALIVGGLALLVIGSDWLVDGAIEVARYFGLSETVIGLTLVAGGTSLPEVATSVLAGLRGQRDIAVGNVVGSNLFNLLSVLGLSAIVAPGGLAVPASILAFDLPVMVATAVACLPIFFTGSRIARWEGALFLAYYVAYTLFLVLAATKHEMLPRYSAVMAAYVLPLTAVTLTVLALRSWRRRRSAPAA